MISPFINGINSFKINFQEQGQKDKLHRFDLKGDSKIEFESLSFLVEIT